MHRKPLGPNNSLVGFADINQKFHKLTGVNSTLYNITDWGGLIPIIIGMLYGIIGLIQLIRRRNIFKVDSNILALGLFYIITFLVYLCFEFVVINRRPVLINGYLEASYPSSTTMLAICFMLTSIYQTNKYFSSRYVKLSFKIIQIIILLFLVVGRTISEVHWLTDIVGGIIISATLLSLYRLFEIQFIYLRTKKGYIS